MNLQLLLTDKLNGLSALLQKWKNVDHRLQEDSTMGDFPYLEWLARDYKQRGEKSGLWTDYLKVGKASLFIYRLDQAVRIQMLG